MASMAVVKSTGWPRRHAAWPSAVARWVLPRADAADKHDAGLVFEEGQPEEVLHLGLVDLFGPGPVELFERLDDGEAGGGHTPHDLPFLPTLSFAFDEPGQVLDCRPYCWRAPWSANSW